MAVACCTALAAHQTFSLFLPNSTAYNNTQTSYWSLQESDLLPSCIAKPHTAAQAADIITALVTNPQCSNTDFAVKGHTHAPAAGFANIDAGVTIDTTGLNDISTNADHSVAHVGAGADWLSVYSYLDPLGKSVAGGRNGLVGVGGLTLGGGISYFSPQVGFTCDTVVNFEVVLASGQLVNANASARSDLFRALKGGTNNFGVVTRFDFATVEIGKILGGSVVNNLTHVDAVLEAFAKIAAGDPYDVHASIVAGLIFNSTAKAWTLSSTPIYTLPHPHPQVYSELFAIPNISSSVELTHLHTLANEPATPALNWQFWTLTFGVSSSFLTKIFSIVNSTVHAFDIPGGILWDIAFEPLPTVFLSHGAGKSSLGTSAKDGNGVIMLLSVLWPGEGEDAKVHAKAGEIVKAVEKEARARGLAKRFVYANYADWSQSPLESYGGANVKALRQTAEKYDPKGVFQRRAPGGFKLPSSG